jgi:hypothetical protein
MRLFVLPASGSSISHGRARGGGCVNAAAHHDLHDAAKRARLRGAASLT